MSIVSWTLISQLSICLILKQKSKIKETIRKAHIMLLKIASEIKGKISDIISRFSSLKIELP